MLDGRVKEGTTDPVTNNQKGSFYTSKLTYQLSSSNRLVGFYAWSQKMNGSPRSVFTSWDSRFESEKQPGFWPRANGSTSGETRS